VLALIAFMVIEGWYMHNAGRWSMYNEMVTAFKSGQAVQMTPTLILVPEYRTEKAINEFSGGYRPNNGVCKECHMHEIRWNYGKRT
jgi:hypothetical protein